MRKLRNLDQFTEDYFRAHPEEIDEYLTEMIQVPYLHRCEFLRVCVVLAIWRHESA
jgi:hypothetical protein